MLDEPITFAEMYRRKMSRDLELARLKKLAKLEQQQQQQSDRALEKGKEIESQPKSLNEILA